MEIDVNQLWAQAVHLYREKEPFRLVGEEKNAQTAINKEYEVESTLSDWLDKYYTFDPEFGTEMHSLADIVGTLAHDDVRLSGSERSQAMELARLLTSKGARRVHTRDGKRWTGLYKR